MNKQNINNTELLKKYGSESYKEIENFHSILIDFLLSDKKIYNFDLGTGRGKGFSFNTFLKKILETKDLYNSVNKIFYVNDLKNIVDVTSYQNALKMCKGHEDEILLLKSNIDSVLNSKDKLEQLLILNDKLKNPILDRDLLKNLIKNIDMYEKSRNNSDHAYKKFIEDGLSNAERNFRKSISSSLKEVSEYKKLKTYKEKLNYLEKNKVLNLLPQIYPSILLKKSKIVFLTMDKYSRIVDTVIDGFYFLYDNEEHFSGNSLIFLDESDALRDKLLKIEADNASNNKFDLIRTIMDFKYHIKLYLDGKFRNYFYDNETKNEAQTLLQQLNAIISKYHIDLNFDISKKESKKKEHFIYSPSTDSIVNDDSNPMIAYYDKESNSMIIDSKNEYLKEEIEECYYYISELIRELYNCFNNCISFVKRLIEKEKENEDKYRESSLIISSVLSLFGYTSDSSIQPMMVRLLSEARKSSNLFNSDEDYYMRTGQYSNIQVTEDENLNAKFYLYLLERTPEKFLYEIINSGGKIVLSSATSVIRGPLNNFNIDWIKFKKHIWEPDVLTKEKIRVYIDEQEKYKQEYLDNIKFEIINENNIKKELELEFIKEIINQSNDIYRVKKLLQMFFAIVNAYKNGSKSMLAFNSFNVIDDNGKEILIYSKLKKILELLKLGNIDLIPTKSSELQEDVVRFEDSINKGRFPVLVTSYQTAKKGLNLQVNVNPALNDITYINERGKIEFENYKNGKSKKIKIDIDAFYFGPITNILPKYSKDVSNIIQNTYIIETCKVQGFISDNQRKKILTDNLNKRGTNENLSPFYGHVQNEQRNEMESRKIISDICQAVGRGSRTNVKSKNTIFFMDEENLKTFNGKHAVDFLPQYNRGLQSLEVKFVLGELFRRVNSEQILIPTNIFLCDKANTTVNNALNKIKEGNIEDYDDIRKEINSFFASEEEFESKKYKEMYLPVKNKEKMNKGYSYITPKRDEYGNDIVSDIIVLNSKKGNNVKSCSIDYLRDGLWNNEELRNVLLKNGIDLSNENGDYVLNPKGVDILKGKIGEIIGNYIIEKYKFLQLQNLPIDIYEIMDEIDIISYENAVVAIDYKFYAEQKTTVFDNYADKEKKYKAKLESIRKKYNKPTIGIVFNSKPLNCDSNTYSINYIDLKEEKYIITVPMILDEQGNIITKNIIKIQKTLESILEEL